MNKLIIGSLFTAILMAGCDYNEKYFEGLQDGAIPTDVKKLEVTFEKYGALDKNSNPGKNGYFTEADPARNFLPAWLAETYFTADAGSSVKVTFKYKENESDLSKAYSKATAYKLVGDDYEAIYGAPSAPAYVDPKSEANITKALDAQFADAAVGALTVAEYKYTASAETTPVIPSFSYDFEGLTTGNITELANWFVSSYGNQWAIKSYSGNTYAQYSAYKATGESGGWLVTPGITVSDKTKALSFDVTIGSYNADCLSVKIATDFDGADVTKATWEDVTSGFTIPKVPTSGYGTAVSAGKFNLAKYVGKKIFVAFNYAGDGANKKTTTYQIDNVLVTSPAVVQTTTKYALYIKTAKGWALDKNDDVISLSADDYASMGTASNTPGKYNNFSSSILPANYLPSFLLKKVGYPMDAETKVVLYRYYNGKATVIYSDEYVYTKATNSWSLNTGLVYLTEQYVLSNGKWNFDPSVVITLKARGDAETSAFYQKITDWVKANKGAKYVSSYGNNDYYYGGSAYQNNFDFRPSAWKAQTDDYKDMTDDKLKELMLQRLPEAFIPALEALHADADVVSGVEVTYTINFLVYDGSATKNASIKYKVTAKGKFAYIDKSLTIL